MSASLIALVGTAPGVMRRRFPLISLVVVCLPLIILSLERSDSFSFAHLLAMMVTTYSVAHECRRGPALTGLGLAISRST